MLPRARNFLLALLEMEERCFSKLSFQSIIITSKVSVALETKPIDTLVGFLCLEVNGSYQTPCPSAPVRKASVASPVEIFAESASPV